MKWDDWQEPDRKREERNKHGDGERIKKDRTGVWERSKIAMECEREGY